MPVPPPKPPEPVAPVPSVDLDGLLALAARITTHVSDHLRSARPARQSAKSSATDIVTELDEWAERHLVGALVDARPDDAIIGEEGTRRSGTTGVEWYIDPIDGTTNFLYGHPGFSVSVGATVDGTAAVGVVADPTLGELFCARTGGGAFRNGAAIRCSNPSDLRQALVATGFGYDPDRRRRQAEVLTKVLPEVRDIRRMGGAALDLCSVACGRVDAYFEYGISPWDIAAGSVIAREAGAIVGDLVGAPTLGRFIVAAGPRLSAPLRALLARAGALLEPDHRPSS